MGKRRGKEWMFALARAMPPAVKIDHPAPESENIHQPSIGPTPEKSQSSRIIGFFENGYMLAVYGILGSVLSAAYTPALILIMFLTSAAVHRSGIVRGCSVWKMQVFVYAIVAILAAGALGSGIRQIESAANVTKQDIVSGVASRLSQLLYAEKSAGKESSQKSASTTLLSDGRDAQPESNMNEPLPSMGFKPESPKSLGLPLKFTVLLGSSSMTLHRDSLVQKTLDDKQAGFVIDPSLPLRIYLTPQGQLRADVTLFNDSDVIAAVIHGTKFDMEDPTWDANYDDDALEIIDQNNNVRFQFDRLKQNLIRVEGFFESDHGKLCADDHVTQVRPLSMELTCSSPTPIFKYPSRFTIHERIVRRR